VVKINLEEERNKILEKLRKAHEMAPSGEIKRILEEEIEQLENANNEELRKRIELHHLVESAVNSISDVITEKDFDKIASATEPDEFIDVLNTLVRRKRREEEERFSYIQ